MSLLGPAEVRALAARLDLAPTKKLGQNFVIDGNTVRRIVAAAGVTAGEAVVEIGPGLGSLTLGLIDAGATVTAVEIDPRLAVLLPETVERAGAPADALLVLTADALTVTALPGTPTSLVANLPYNVSVPVLLHFLEHFPQLQRALVMVQAEVGERLAAAPGSRVYGIPSLKAAWYADVSLAGRVGRQVFWPVPNVDSILVRLDRRTPPGTEVERRAVFALVDAAFGQRRKMLRQSLAGVLGAGAGERIAAAGIDPTLRGEQLTVGDFLAIARTAGLP